jgi:hypothetical protein
MSTANLLKQKFNSKVEQNAQKKLSLSSKSISNSKRPGGFKLYDKENNYKAASWCCGPYMP